MIRRIVAGAVLVAAGAALIFGYYGLTQPQRFAAWEKPTWVLAAFLATAGVLTIVGGPVRWARDRWRDWRYGPTPPVALTGLPPVPSLRVADRPELDASARCFRLRIWNDSLTRCHPKVVVTSLTDERGTDLLVRAQIPFELGWTGLVDGERPALARNDSDGWTVALLWMRFMPALLDSNVFVYGTRHRYPLGMLRSLDGRSLAIRLAVSTDDFPDVHRIEREFRFKADAQAPLGLRLS